MSDIISRRRSTALLGAALIAGAASVPLAYQSSASAAPASSSITNANNNSFASIVDAAKPAVVTIVTTMRASDADDGDDSPQLQEQFKQFFNEEGIPQLREAPQPKSGERAEALGSGFIVSADGYIVTNNHVIANASKIKVTLDDGTELAGILVGADPKTDLAVVKVDAKKPLPTLAWGDSNKLRLGDQVLAIGNPFGVGTTVTAGIVSARGRDLHSGPYDDFIQIDAPINHGNSGGPLVDGSGKVVGINTAIYSPNGGSVGVGFAIPAGEATMIVGKLQKDGSIDHGYLGVQIQPVTQDIADAIGLAKPEGALVADVTKDSPAGRAGLKPGDVITAVGSKTAASPKELSRAVADLSPGDNEKLTLWRDGKTVELSVGIGGNDDGKPQFAAAKGAEEVAPNGPRIGVSLADLTPEVRARLGVSSDLQGAVIAQVSPEKTAAEAGLKPGDIILSVNDKTIHDATEAKTAVAAVAKAEKKSVLLLIQRGDNRTFVAVPFAAA
ncbi:DegQ family serine endoprotease [Rhizobium grahamii]|uniref:Probable periplasmic serine endoprotease DegP-like n=1 Tax=Rhizobium grahamii CCGE 502 TaxID=990285 RepID=S3ICC8_9HYPH|nr:DegQ family serine endoprotease [Rhizobium grahamii]EPE96863.1 protease Do [Rhizobium grahamii CCGE 502]